MPRRSDLLSSLLALAVVAAFHPATAASMGSDLTSPPLDLWQNVMESPAPTTGAAMAVNSPNRAAYLFGGNRPGVGLCAHVVRCDLSLPALTWELVSTGVGPAARQDAHVHFDDASGRLLVLGGTASPASFGDLWAWNPGAGGWSELTTAHAGPSSIVGQQPLAHDFRRNRLLYFDYTAAGIPSQAWVLDLAGPMPDWLQLTTSGTPVIPPGAVAAYDSLADRVFVFGGSIRSLWQLDLGTGAWTRVLNDAQCPFNATTEMTLAWDGVGNRLIAHRTVPGNYINTHATVALGVAPEWIPLQSLGGPTHGARPWVHDRQRGEILFDDLSGSVPSLWTLASVGPIAWTSRVAPNRPMGVVLPQGVADSEGRWWYIRDGLQFCRAHLDDLGRFESLAPAEPGPQAPNTAAMAWDPVDRRVLLAMSRLVNETVLPGELWALVPEPSPHWTSVPTTPAPLGVGNAAAFDEAHRWLYVTVASPQNLWRVDLSVSPATWTLLGPLPIIVNELGIDPEGRRLLAVNGPEGLAIDIVNGIPAFGPVLTMSGPKIAAFAYDRRRDRMLVHNGAYQVSNTLVFERIGTDALDGPSPPVFSRLDVPNATDTPSTASLGVYDPVLDRMLLLNGYDYWRPDGSHPAFYTTPGMWTLQFDPSVSIRMELLEVAADEAGIRVRFAGDGPLQGVLAVERDEESGGDWQAVGVAEETMPGLRIYVDRAAAAGVAYRYRGRYRDEEGEHVTAASLPVRWPGRVARLSLVATRGSVVRGGALDFAIVVPGSGVATLELVDIRGRRVARLEIVGTEGETRTVTLEPDPSAGPGLYFARLSDGRSSIVRRIVRLRP